MIVQASVVETTYDIQLSHSNSRLLNHLQEKEKLKIVSKNPLVIRVADKNMQEVTATLGFVTTKMYTKTILDFVFDIFKVKIRDRTTRKEHAVFAKHIIAYILRRGKKMQLIGIGAVLGLNHSSVTNAIRKIESYRAYPKSCTFNDKLDTCLRRFLID